jgi:ferritin-like metal-binding protein YciE
MAEKKLTDLFYDTLKDIYFAAGLLAAGQAVEHYEISRYGTLKTWATRLGLKDAVTLLDQNLQEEKKTDILLSKLAEASVNAEAG